MLWPIVPYFTRGVIVLNQAWHEERDMPQLWMAEEIEIRHNFQILSLAYDLKHFLAIWTHIECQTHPQALEISTSKNAPPRP